MHSLLLITYLSVAIYIVFLQPVSQMILQVKLVKVESRATVEFMCWRTNYRHCWLPIVIKI